MLTKMKKKNHKNVKIKKKNEKRESGLKIWWIGGFQKNLVRTHKVVSRKPKIKDGRTTDDRRPLPNSSSAV